MSAYTHPKLAHLSKGSWQFGTRATPWFFKQGDRQLILQPDFQDDSGLPYWELFMPTEQVLTVGPEFFWECKSIHERD